MNVLIILASAMAVASAGYLSPYAGHGGPIHIPVIGHNGVPVDTPEVQHARAAHFAALAQASSHAGSGGYDTGSYDTGSYDTGSYDDGSYKEGLEVAHGGPVAGHYSGHRATPHAYPTTHGIAHVTHDGVPLNTPEVNAAAAHHFAAFNEALSRGGTHGYGGAHYRRRRSVYGHGAYHGPIHIPVIGHNGVPVDTPEVQHARAAHLAALASAGHGGYYAHGAPVVAYAAPWAHHGVPAIAHDGTPLDTAEVAHAKAAHFAAYNEAAARNGVHGHAGVNLGYAGPWGHYSNGAPADTPEVAHAKAAHFAAHAAARGHY